MADLIRSEGAEPFSLRQGSGDHTCALTTALGIVTALLARERSGEGRLVETSLLRSAVYGLGADFANQVRMGTVTRTQPRAAATNPINNFFQTREGRWIFVMPRSRSPSDFARICKAVGADHLAANPRFETPEARAEHSPVLIAALDLAFAATPFEAAAAALTASDIVWSPVQTPLDVLADPQAEAAGCFTEVSDSVGGVFRAPNTPVGFDGDDATPKRPVARHGQHTDELLIELGYPREVIAAMRAQDVVD